MRVIKSTFIIKKSEFLENVTCEIKNNSNIDNLPVN